MSTHVRSSFIIVFRSNRLQDHVANPSLRKLNNVYESGEKARQNYICLAKREFSKPLVLIDFLSKAAGI